MRVSTGDEQQRESLCIPPGEYRIGAATMANSALTCKQVSVLEVQFASRWIGCRIGFCEEPISFSGVRGNQ